MCHANLVPFVPSGQSRISLSKAALGEAINHLASGQMTYEDADWYSAMLFGISDGGLCHVRFEADKAKLHDIAFLMAPKYDGYIVENELGSTILCQLSDESIVELANNFQMLG